MKSSDDLRRLLGAINRKSYPAYKDTKGAYKFPDYVLSIDHVQGDPFASPSRVSIEVPGKKAGFPLESYAGYERRVALSDYVLRLFGNRIERYNHKAKGSGKSGLISVSRCGQEILERTACTVDEKTGNLLIRLEVGFPAFGRTINSDELIKIFYEFLPVCVAETCFYPRYSSKNKQEVESVRELAEDQASIRQQLKELGLAAFVADGAVLPRESGVSSKPMKNAVIFHSPASLAVELQLPNKGALKGMGIPKGITLIVGGGYHGKSTLLEALELGVYNHIAGDGREYVITDDTAVKLRAEDGRSIRNVDISLFIGELPNGKSTENFSTEDASGSTSQAANVVEGLEAGARLFLVDEDTSATNFMVRDELMQRVVHRDQEPITPFSSRVRMMYEKLGISTILVAGSSGAYFYEADRVIQMNRYEPEDITGLAKREAANLRTGPMDGEYSRNKAEYVPARRILIQSPAFKNCDRMKLKMQGRDAILIDRETIDLRYVEQLVDYEQYQALAYLLKYAEIRLADGKRSLNEVVELLWEEIKRAGLASAASNTYLPVDLALPRRQEIFACLNRYRGLIINKI